MKRLGDMMWHEPNEEGKEALHAVLDAAHAWKRGDLDLDGVRGYCSGLDRNRAIRAAELGSDDKKLLMALTDALVYQDERRGGFMSKHGYITPKEINELGAKEFTNWEGRRVWVWPLFQMNGNYHYPPVHLPPGDERRAQEAAMNEKYRAYRDEKKRKEGRGRS